MNGIILYSLWIKFGFFCQLTPVSDALKHARYINVTNVLGRDKIDIKNLHPD